MIAASVYSRTAWLTFRPNDYQGGPQTHDITGTVPSYTKLQGKIIQPDTVNVFQKLVYLS
jgi:hypothetical protein